MEGMLKNKIEKNIITLTDEPRGVNPNLENPVVLLNDTLVDGNHKLRFKEINPSYFPDILKINTIEDIVSNKSKLEKITNNKWVNQLLEIPNLKIEDDKKRSLIYSNLMYEKYGEEYNGYNDDSFITEELLVKTFREKVLQSIIQEAKRSAGNFGEITLEK